MSEEKENFLDRWSRRKQERATEAAAAPAEKKSEYKKKDEPLPALPPIEQLKPDSDFTPFMDPRVDKATRREALKKMFADAHFKVADPFEPYSIDLTGEDPIPAEMLNKLDHARRLLFDEKKAQAQELAREQTKEAVEKKEVAEQPLPESKDVARKQDA